MGVRLIREVLRSAPAGLNPSERLVLIVIAETASDETREGWPTMEHLTDSTGLAKSSVRRVLASLSEAALIARVPVGVDRSGRPVYAHRGHATVYRMGALGSPRKAIADERLKPVDNSGKALTGEQLPDEKGAHLRSERRSPASERRSPVSALPSVPSEIPQINPRVEPVDERSAVIGALFDRTGRSIDGDQAERVVRQLLDGRTVRNRIRYLVGAIARDPSPERFLPTPTPPTFRAGAQR